MPPIALLAFSLLLVSCAQKTVSPRAVPLQERLANPLFAERYWYDRAEHMADFFRQKSALTKDPVKSAVIEDLRTTALSQLQVARGRKAEGVSATFISGGDPVQGTALLTDTTLFLGPDFLTYPAPALHVYLTAMVDPRDGTFPDRTTVDLGSLQSPYGEQEYGLPSSPADPQLRTVVLYDATLERLYGFAQLSR